MAAFYYLNILDRKTNIGSCRWKSFEVKNYSVGITTILSMNLHGFSNFFVYNNKCDIFGILLILTKIIFKLG